MRDIPTDPFALGHPDPANSTQPRLRGSVPSDRGQDVAVCVTLYNEDVSLFRPTLDSILEGLGTLNAAAPQHRNAIVAIIIDGEDKLSEGVRAYLDTLGLTQIDQAAGVTISQRSIDLMPAMSVTLRVIAKAANAGKLDSHRWFYDHVCVEAKPHYCFQVDTGSILRPKAITEMCEAFDADPDIAAIAGNILIEPPEDGDLLQRFQCGDFAVQKTIRWPSEALSGFLSVIPGQFSGVRWQALSRPAEGGGPAPKERYLRGLTCRSAAERLMFLAEDRVMGIELLTQRGTRNRLHFAPRATCYTDSCHSVGELLKQRRRWLNGFLVCRIWMIATLVRCLLEQSLPVRRKMSIIFSLMNLTMQQLLEWLLPLINLLLLAGTYRSLTALAAGNDTIETLATGGFVSMVIIWFLPTVLALTGDLQTWPRARLQTLIGLVIAVAVMIIGINITAVALEPELIVYGVLMTVPFTVPAATFLSAAILNRELFRHLRASVLTFIAMAPAFWLMVSSYAFFNLHDGSWGTKGLSHSTDEGALQRRFRQLRAGVVMGWLGSNAVMAWIVLSGGLLSTSMFVVGTLHITLLLSGVMGALWIRSRQPGRRTGLEENPVYARDPVAARP